MKECATCEYRGYSAEVCRLHLKQCDGPEGEKKMALAKKAGNVGMKALVGIGAGVLTATVGIGAASVLGAKALAYAMTVKVSAGVGGGALGLAKGIKDKEEQATA